MKIYDLILRCDDTDAKRKPCPAKGYFYQAFLNGEPLSRSQTNAETDACRELLRRGMTGKARFWREGKTSPDVEMNIERAAQWQLIEEDRDGLRWRRYRNPADSRAAGETTPPATVVADGSKGRQNSPVCRVHKRVGAAKETRGEYTSECN